MRKLIALLLLLLTLPLSLFACGSVSEEEILPVAEGLIRSSEILNEIYLGEGIPTGEIAFENYRYADDAFCTEHGIKTIAALKAKTEAVYTDGVCEILYRKTFTTDHTLLGEYREGASGGLYVLIGREAWHEDTAYEYLYDTLTLESASKKAAVVSITLRITPEGYPAQEVRLSLPLVLTKDGWRCDKLTYARYNYEEK